MARLLLDERESIEAERFARQAYERNHRVPRDTVIYGLALEAVGDWSRAAAMAEAALVHNDRDASALALKRRVAAHIPAP